MVVRISNGIKRYYWKLYFSAYWIAYILGEKDDPQINATSFLILIFGMNSTSLLFLVIFILKGELPYYGAFFTLAFLAPAIFNIYVLFSKNFGYKRRMKDFNYLAKSENKPKALKYIILTFGLSLLIMVITASINNSTLQAYFSF